MYTVEKTIEINDTIVKIYYTDKNHFGTNWTREEAQAKIFDKETDAEKIANLDKSTIKVKQ